MSAADQPQSKPLAQGDLSRTPFGHVVLYLHRESMSGTLIVDRGGYETKVLFRNGRAVAARPMPRGAGLQAGLLELCGLTGGTYGFWEGDLVGEGSGVTRGTVEPFMFVAESLRSHAREDVIARVIERYLRAPLTLLPDVDLKKLGLRGVEARVAEQLRTQPMLGYDFVERTELVPADARKLLYLLLITKQVAAPGTDPGSSGVRSAISGLPPAPPGAASPSSIPPRAGTPSVRPSAPPGASHAPSTASPTARPSAAPATARPSARPSAPPGGSVPAWQQLASRRPGSITPRTMPPMPAIPTPSMAPPPVETLDDIGKLRRAELLSERRNFYEAGRIADDLVARNPKNADFHALRAFIYYQQFSGDRPPQPLLQSIERSLRLNEQQSRALYVKGLVFKRMGKQLEALHYFQKTLDADPEHMEAQRELRLAKMRRDR